MGGGAGRKGRAGERELRSRFDELGFRALTVPGQWGTEHDFDDYVYGSAKYDQLYAAECKRRSKNRFYLKAEQIAEVLEFADLFHRECEPIVCVRWDQDTTWYVRHLATLDRTASGNISIDPQSSRANWATLAEFVDIRGGHD